MTWMEEIAVARDITVALAAIVTAGAAVYGLRKWKSEITGRMEVDAARGLLRAMYKLRNQIHAYRSPFVGSEEFPAGYAGALHTGSAEEEAKAWVHVYQGRWEPLIEAYREFEEALLEAEALWGEPAKAIERGAKECVVRLNAATESLLSDKAAGGKNFKADPDFGEKVRRTVQGSAADTDNPLIDTLNQIIAMVEDQVRPHLKRS